MVEQIEVEDFELCDLSFKVGATREVTPLGLSIYYYSLTMSPDGRYIALFVEGIRREGVWHDKIVIWDTKAREIVNIFKVSSPTKEKTEGKKGPHIKKIKFMPSRNYLAILCNRAGRLRDSILIYDVTGDLVKEIEFPSYIKRHKTNESYNDTLFYKRLYDFDVSPDSRKVVITVKAGEIYKLGDSHVPIIANEKAWNPWSGHPALPASLIYDIEREEIINLIRDEDIGCFFLSFGRALWPVDNGIVRTTIKPRRKKRIRYKDCDRGDMIPIEEWWATGYATMINPYNGEIIHKVPLRHNKTVMTRYTETAHRYNLYEMGYSTKAYLVKPGGEYIANAIKGIEVARISDFDAEGNYLGSDPAWRTAEEFKPRVANLDWSSNNPELMYQYQNSFITLNYDKNEVTRQIFVSRTKLNSARIFWTRNDTIYFLQLNRGSDFLGVLKI